MPRKGLVFNKVRKHLKVTPKELRKLIVSLSNTVEQKMCSGKWEEIEYHKSPSLAMSRYSKAFGRNDYDRFTEFIQNLKKGKTTVNAGALYPYDITKNVSHGDADLASEQWKALPNWMEGSSAGNNKNLSCMDVAVSLGLYISERNEGAFKDMFMTFSSTPRVQTLLGSLKDRMLQLERAEWGYNTNIEAAFQTILDQAVKFNIPQNEMPTKVLILSDMEFDSAVKGEEINPSVMTMIDEMYTEAGYTRPGIIFWNINSYGDNFPAKIMKSVISNPNSLTPINIMNETVNSERYESVTI